MKQILKLSSFLLLAILIVVGVIRKTGKKIYLNLRIRMLEITVQ